MVDGDGLSLGIMRNTIFFRSPARCCLIVLTLVLGLFSSRVAAQTPTPHLDPALVSYFSGEWTGEGAFAGGKPISADLSFHLSLDSAWLIYEHS